MSSSLLISKIGPESDVLLRNLFEHYIHDMAEWFEIDTKSDGSYSYDTSLVWEKGYDAYLAKVGDSIAGIALVGPAVEWLGERGAYDVHEFCDPQISKERLRTDNSNSPLERTTR